jgi:hypothetical protein
MPKRAASSRDDRKEPEKEKKGRLANISPERRRRIYLTYRMPELVAALEKLAAETQTLTDRLNDKTLAQGTRARGENEERLIYLREYRPVLMAELDSLRKEHKKLAKVAG